MLKRNHYQCGDTRTPSIAGMAPEQAQRRSVDRLDRRQRGTATCARTVQAQCPQHHRPRPALFRGPNLGLDTL